MAEEGPDDPGASADESLAVQAAAGDHDAFAELYRRYLPVALRSARRARRAHPQLDVEEAANLALTRLWEVVETFDTSREFAPWAAVVISHAVRSAARATRTVRSTFNWSAMLARRDDDGDDRLAELAAIPADGEDALGTILQREEEQMLADQLAEVLSAREAKVIRLRLAGWTYREIAARLSLDHKAVDNAMRRAVAKLREAFGPDGAPAVEGVPSA